MIANFEEPDRAIGTLVQGNDIGTDITGTLAAGNAIGVDIEGASSSLIGTDGRGGAGDAAGEPHPGQPDRRGRHQRRPGDLQRWGEPPGRARTTSSRAT